MVHKVIQYRMPDSYYGEADMVAHPTAMDRVKSTAQLGLTFAILLVGSAAVYHFGGRLLDAVSPQEY